MKIRFLFYLVGLIIFMSCKLLSLPTSNDFNEAYLSIGKEFAKRDSCNKILMSKVINYRECYGQFPNSENDFYTQEITNEEFKTILRLIVIPEFKISDTLRNGYNNTWLCNCQQKIDSVSIVTYHKDTADIFTRIKISSSDTTYTILNSRRRLYFENDTLYRVNPIPMLFDVKTYDLKGNEIELNN